MSEISETEIKAMTKEQNYMQGYKNGKSDALDQIRAEIKALTDGAEPELIRNVDVLAIIDKYKAESEVDNNANA